MQERTNTSRGTPRGLGYARAVVALLTAVTAMVALAACGGSSSGAGTGGAGGGVSSIPADEGTPKRGGTLTVGRAFDPANLNPYTCACENPSLQTMVQIYDTLTRFAPDATKPPEPSLAESWKISADNLTYTFQIREAKFSNGAPVTAEDVAYSLKRASGPTSLYGLLYPIASIKASGPRTVVVKLKEVTPAFLYSLGFVASSITPAKEVKKAGDAAFGERPIGSGPFILKRWIKGQQVDLVRNPTYWRKGQPYLDAVTLKFIPNDNTRSVAFQSGDIDVGDEIPYSQIDRLNRSGKGRVLVQPSSAVFSIQLNNTVKPLDDVKVRQALNYATPRDAIQKVVFKGLPPVANSISPKLQYWTDAVKPYPTDVEKAKQLLSESSAPNGFTVKVNITGTDDASRQTAQIVQDAWAKIGVKLQIQEADFGTVTGKWAAGNYQATMLLPDANTSDLPAPDEFAYLLFGSPKETRNLYSNYDNPKVEGLVHEAITTGDDTKRQALFEQIQRETMDNPPHVPLTFAQYRAAVSDHVKGFAYALTGWYYLDKVWLG